MGFLFQTHLLNRLGCDSQLSKIQEEKSVAGAVEGGWRQAGGEDGLFPASPLLVEGAVYKVSRRCPMAGKCGAGEWGELALAQVRPLWLQGGGQAITSPGSGQCGAVWGRAGAHHPSNAPG